MGNDPAFLAQFYLPFPGFLFGAFKEIENASSIAVHANNSDHGRGSWVSTAQAKSKKKRGQNPLLMRALRPRLLKAQLDSNQATVPP